MKDVSYFDLGLHAFAHDAYTLESKDFIEKSVSSAMRAANKIGVKPTSYGGPWNMVEDINDPKKLFSVLKKNKFNCIRYVGEEEDDLKSNHVDKIIPTFEKYGLKAINVSNYFEETSSWDYINQILKKIEESIDEDAVFCLCTHDFTHKKTTKLKYILDKVSKLAIEGKIELVNMRMLADEKIN